MLFFITMKKVAYALNNGKLELFVKPIETQTKDYQYWVEDGFLCKIFILNGLVGDLYDYYNLDKSTKKIWVAFQKKYDIEKVETKKYAVSRYLKY